MTNAKIVCSSTALGTFLSKFLLQIHTRALTQMHHTREVLQRKSYPRTSRGLALCSTIADSRDVIVPSIITMRNIITPCSNGFMMTGVAILPRSDDALLSDHSAYAARCTNINKMVLTNMKIAGMTDVSAPVKNAIQKLIILPLCFLSLRMATGTNPSAKRITTILAICATATPADLVM